MGAYLEVEGLKKKGLSTHSGHSKSSWGFGVLGVPQRVQSKALVGIHGVKLMEAQRSKSILSTKSGLNSNFANSFKVRYKEGSMLCSDKKTKDLYLQ